ncbi:MAG: LLM class F420-dependent oxidoreductase [Salana multivorans]|uniref:LLM class F420-dependent oxidoreductase n=1 Tax=Salana multivorans TaxID=120377 RepID=UPI0009619BC5|nr:LLM class F420-dependent oxidoreductase [Salana multivorans]MBN8883727.1 LLM class F420-dependent oxidoreductase [Salana multivorans]OJX95401.1 MAG: LLM class F420-dependent oxidoreductase [Micrococcales bacterium 73-15]
MTSQKLRLGLHTGYWSSGPPAGAADAVRWADAHGLDSVWTAEAYGSDAFTPLAWWGSGTTRVRLATGVAQLSARTPTATAMAALTLDHLSGGRFVLGLGASGPQVVEGWYGQPYARPLARTREYVAIVRDVLRREAPVTAPGPAYRLPLPASSPGATGEGRALRSTVHPLRADLPIHLAAQGPRNTELAAEIADGWLPAFLSPALDDEARGLLAAGFARRSERLRPAEEFEVCATVPLALAESVEAGIDLLRGHVALYAGGMGSATTNFHHEALRRVGARVGPGVDDALAEVAERYRSGDRAGAAAAVPADLVREIALVGTPADVVAQLDRWRDTCVTTLVLQTDPRVVPLLEPVLAAPR